MAVAPWSVKGVNPEAREAAKIAARRAGLTLGEWLNQTILTAATGQLKRGSVPVVVPSEAQGSAAPADREIASLSAGQPPAPTIQAMFERIQSLSKRLEVTEERTSRALQPLESQIETLRQEIEKVRGQTGVSTAPIERAVTRLSERIQRIEEGWSRDAKRGPFGLLRSK